MTVRLCFPAANVRRTPGAQVVGDRLCAEYNAQSLFFVVSTGRNASNPDAPKSKITLAEVQTWIDTGCSGLFSCEDCPHKPPA